jgi:hypothetical protein
MQFVLSGFTQEMEYRVFAFEGVVTGQLRVQFTVRADLALSRRYGIRLQDLPLLCRGVLEHRTLEAQTGHEQQQAWTFTEDAMRTHQSNSAAARDLAAQNRKAPRRPIRPDGAAWRSPGAPVA